MYICPVCGKKNKTENAICEFCRFDRSRDYEVYATISPLKGKDNHAVSKKKLDYEGKKHPGAFACSKCKSVHFYLFPETNKILCMDCGAEIELEELHWKQAEHKENDLVPNPASEATAVRAKEKQKKTFFGHRFSAPSVLTPGSLTISPFTLQKFPFVSVQYSRYVAAIKENGEITYTGQVNVGELEGFSQWKNIKALAGDYFHTVALKSDGTVVAVGDNRYGQCDVSSWRNIAAITTGPGRVCYYTLALRTDGTVVATKGLRCHNEIQKWNNIVSVAVGTGSEIVGLKSDGTVATIECDRYYTEVASWKNIKKIACGPGCIVGLTQNRTVVATKSIYSISDLIREDNIIAISCGNFHIAGLRADGTVVAAGENDKSQCDTFGWSDIIDISCTRDITVGLKKNGTIITTGNKEAIKGYEDLFLWRDIVAIEYRGNHLIGLKADGTVCVSGYKDLSGVRIPDIYKR